MISFMHEILIITFTHEIVMITLLKKMTIIILLNGIVITSQYDGDGHPCALGVNHPCAQVDDLSCALNGDDNPCVFYLVRITLGQ